ncbi:MAG: copper chaperone PCu(A)C [Rhodospirillales bacterium]|nr:copper chaperone PCu(A)C [Rhodospirillales bacterium]
MTLRIPAALFVFAFAGIAALPRAEAHVYETGPVVVSHPWARASAPTARNGAAYLRIESAPGSKDRLIGARSPVAETVEVHETTVTDGIARMRRVPEIRIAPGHPIDLAPGGMHMMLIGLKSPLKEGDLFPLILTFEEAGDVQVDVIVESPGAMGPHGMAGTAMPEHQHGADPAHKH